MRQNRFITWGISSFVIIAITQSVPVKGEISPPLPNQNPHLQHSQLSKLGLVKQSNLSINPKNILSNSANNLQAQKSGEGQRGDFCNSGVVTPGKTSNLTHDGSAYRTWTDFRRGRESINPEACGRLYYVKTDPSHYNYGIKFVYLVNGRGICVVPFLYKENDDGSLENLRSAPECINSGTISEDLPDLPTPQPQPNIPQTIEEKQAFRKSDQQVASELAALRERGKLEGWTFEVGDSQAFRILLEILAGTRFAKNFNPNLIDILNILALLIQEASQNNPIPPAPQPVPPQPVPPQPAPNPNQLPSHFDAREWGVVPEIRMQGSCGSCWAFAAVSSQEITFSSRYQQSNSSLNLSEQQLLSCNTQGFSCEGGFVSDQDSDYRYESGLVNESTYPYQGKQTPCQRFNRPTSGNLYDVKAFDFVLGPNDNPGSPANITKIKQAIYSFGNVWAGVSADNAFQGYKGGVFNACTSIPFNHAINIIGWDDAGGYWIIRNSWNTDWGEGGYGKIKYGCSSIGIAAAVPRLPQLSDCNGGNCQPRNPSSPPWLKVSAFN